MWFLFFTEQCAFLQLMRSWFLSLLLSIFPSNKPVNASMSCHSEQPQPIYISRQTKNEADVYNNEIMFFYCHILEGLYNFFPTITHQTATPHSCTKIQNTSSWVYCSVWPGIMLMWLELSCGSVFILLYVLTYRSFLPQMDSFDCNSLNESAMTDTYMTLPLPYKVCRNDQNPVLLRPIPAYRDVLVSVKTEQIFF